MNNYLRTLIPTYLDTVCFCPICTCRKRDVRIQVSITIQRTSYSVSNKWSLALRMESLTMQVKNNLQESHVSKHTVTQKIFVQKYLCGTFYVKKSLLCIQLLLRVSKNFVCLISVVFGDYENFVTTTIS